MAKSAQPIPDQVLLDHLKWHTDFLDKTLEQLAQRASGLLGFVGVELAILVGVSELHSSIWIALASIGLILTTLLLLWSIRPLNIGFPDLASNIAAYESTEVVRLHNIAQQFLRTDETEKSPIKNLENSIRQRGIFFKVSFALLAFSQLMVGISTIAISARGF